VSDFTICESRSTSERFASETPRVPASKVIASAWYRVAL
jgi:hypothetical protein